MTEHTAVVTPAMGWRQTVTFGPDRQQRILECSFHIPVDSPPDLINSYLDVSSRCLDRQIAYYDLVDAIEQREALRAKLIADETQVLSIQARSEAAHNAREGQRGEWSMDKMTPQDKNAFLGSEAALKEDRAKFEFWTNRIEKLRRTFEGNAAEFGSDSDPGGPEG